MQRDDAADAKVARVEPRKRVHAMFRSHDLARAGLQHLPCARVMLQTQRSDADAKLARVNPGRWSMQCCRGWVMTMPQRVAALALCESDEADPKVNRAEPQKKVQAIHQEMAVLVGCWYFHNHSQSHHWNLAQSFLSIS